MSILFSIKEFLDQKVCPSPSPLPRPLPPFFLGFRPRFGLRPQFSGASRPRLSTKNISQWMKLFVPPPMGKSGSAPSHRTKSIRISRYSTQSMTGLFSSLAATRAPPTTPSLQHRRIFARCNIQYKLFVGGHIFPSDFIPRVISASALGASLRLFRKVRNHELIVSRMPASQVAKGASRSIKVPTDSY